MKEKIDWAELLFVFVLIVLAPIIGATVIFLTLFGLTK